MEMNLEWEDCQETQREDSEKQLVDGQDPRLNSIWISKF